MSVWSDDALAAVFESAPVGIAITTDDGRFARVNPALLRATGWQEADLLGRAVLEFIEPGDRDLVARSVERLKSGASSVVSFDEHFRCADGGSVELTITLSVLYDSHGTRVGRVGYTQDLSARRQADSLAARAVRDLAGTEAFAHVGSYTYVDATDASICSAEFRRIHGLAADDPVLPTTILDRLHPDDRERVVHAIDNAREQDLPSFVVQHRIIHPTLGVRWIRVRADADRDEHGARIGVTGVVMDVTASVEADAARREAEERFRRAFEDAPAGMAIMDLKGRFLQVNDALARMTGYRADQLTRMTINELSHPDNLEEGFAKAGGVLRGQADGYTIQARLIGADGGLVWVDCNVSLTRDVEGRPLHLIAHVVDVTVRRAQDQELHYLATHDPLTGLLNRRAFEDELARHSEQSARGEAAGALLVLDIDHFKHVNDSHGHGAGDALIVRVATSLRQRLRTGDVVARLGGDEFAVLLHRADEAEARTVADALLDAVRSHGIPGSTESRASLDDPVRTRRVSTSIGIALFDAFRGQTSADVLAAADLAMYAAKEAGRDRAVVHHPSDQDQQRMQARARWLERIRSALDEDRLVLYAQPIRGLAADDDPRFELLLRMVDEDGTLVCPNDFLGVAERFGLMPAIDQWVVGQAISLLQDQHAAGRPVTLEVNVSGRSMGDATLLAAIESELDRRPFARGSLVIEVTETAAVADMTEAKRFAARLSQLGCSFALDDFGAGFGSFYYAKHLPFDYLKIDGEFVRNCRRSKVDQVVIHAVVELARGLGKRTVAEFVQDDESVDLLREAGVDFGQGHHLGLPLPVLEVLARA